MVPCEKRCSKEPNRSNLGCCRADCVCETLFDEEKSRVSPAQWTTAFGSLTSHPAAFLIVILYGVFWFLFEQSTFDWHAIATLAVWTMTLFIQRADRRDTLAIHAKLDELLKATREARTELASIDEREPEAIEKIRDRERREAETR
jgi:low affinity Fe/Cu permease